MPARSSGAAVLQPGSTTASAESDAARSNFVINERTTRE